MFLFLLRVEGHIIFPEYLYLLILVDESLTISLICLLIYVKKMIP